MVGAESRLRAFQDITKSSTSVEGSGISVSYLSNSYKKKGNKSGNKGNNKGTKQKYVSPNDNTKTGEKQN